jgi:hypothetical protein
MEGANMSRRELAIGSFVHFTATDGVSAVSGREYRIQQLLTLKEGLTLYKIKTDAEPFDRVVAERDLMQRS